MGAQQSRLLDGEGERFAVQIELTTIVDEVIGVEVRESHWR